MKLLKNFELVPVGGEFILIPVGDEAQRFHSAFVLNEESAFILRLLQTFQTSGSLVKALLEEYDVDLVTAERDVQYLLSRLNEFKILESI